MVPQTGDYMVAGYVVIFTGMALYVASLWWRWRRAKALLAMLEEEAEEA